MLASIGARIRRWPKLTAFVVILLALYLGVRLYEWATGTSITVSQGSTIWITVDRNTPWLSRAVKLGLTRPVPAATPGTIEWRTPGPGFEVGELPVIVDGQEIDRILFARIDPRHYRFEVRNDPSGKRTLPDWMRDSGAALIVNGSYYAHDGKPATPVVINGKRAGPAEYEATQGVFVAGPRGAAIVDLAKSDWRKVLVGSHAAMVSYPMLIGEDGESRAPANTGWLANRSFLAQDAQGRILVGTTKDGFFALDRLAAFLKQAPLGLTRAIDLDGGPVACQGIALPGYTRSQCGKWELQIDKQGYAKMLPTWPWAYPSMPMVLMVYPK